VTVVVERVVVVVVDVGVVVVGGRVVVVLVVVPRIVVVVVDVDVVVGGVVVLVVVDPCSGLERSQHHDPVGGRAQGQVPLLRAGGAGQDVLEVGGGAAVLRVDEVREPLGCFRRPRPWLAAGEDGRDDQLAGRHRGGRPAVG